MSMVQRDGGSSRRELQDLSRSFLPFSESFQAKGTLRNGVGLNVRNQVVQTSNDPALFVIMLDASGSMNCKQSGQYKFRILFEFFGELVKSGDALRPNDIICVWCFNMKTTFLYRVETKNFLEEMDYIQNLYQKELQSDARMETHLYEGVALVMDAMRNEWNENASRDFFLVTFTDGQDNQKGNQLSTMMRKLNNFEGRLHTVFITVGRDGDPELARRFDCHEDMELFPCESTERSEISKAFNHVRECIKGVLWYYFTTPAGANGPAKAMSPDIGRLAVYGKNKHSIDKNMRNRVRQEMQKTSAFLDGFNALQLTD